MSFFPITPPIPLCLDLDGIDQIPNMTSNTAPSGTAAASSIFSGSYDAFKAMDGTGARWHTASTTTGWLTYDFGSGSGFVPLGYTITGSSEVTKSPKTWTFDGWNGVGWDTLDTQTNAPSWSASEKRTYYPSPEITTSYEKFRVNVTANQGSGGGLAIEEFEIFKVGDCL